MRHHHIKALASLAAALLLTACTNEELTAEGTAQSSPQPVTFSLSVPDAINATRAGAAYETRNSALGGITNADWTSYKLRVQFAALENQAQAGDDPDWHETALNASGATRLTKWFENATEAAATKQFVAYLKPGKAYKIVCWADFVPLSALNADKHYSTTSLTNITCLDTDDKQLNDESRDAYFITEDFDFTTHANTDLVLRRPFAKLRVVTTDWGQAQDMKPAKVTLRYKGCQRFAGLNAVTGEALGGTVDLTPAEEKDYTAGVSADVANTADDSKYYSLSYDASQLNRTVAVDYLVADVTQTVIGFTFTALKADGSEITHKDIGTQRLSDQPNPDYSATDQTKTPIATDIPIQRNHLTTILGNLCQKPDTRLKVTVSEGFHGEYVDGEPWWNPKELNPEGNQPALENDVYQVYTADELAWLANKQGGIDKSVKLCADIDMNNISQWKPIHFAPTATGLEWDGNHKTIRNYYATPVTSGQEYVSAIFAEIGGVTFKDTKFENITLQGLHEPQQYAPANATQLNIGIIGKASGDNTTVSGITADHVFVYVPEAGTGGTPVATTIAGMLIADGQKAAVSGCALNDCNLYIPATLGLDATSNALYVGALFGKKTDDCTTSDCTLNGCYIHKPAGYTAATFPGLTIDSSDGAIVVDADGK